LDKVHRETLVDYCMHLLSVPDWSKVNKVTVKKVPLHLCEGLQKRSQFPRGKASVRLSKALYESPWDSGRACYYRNFARQEKIIRDLGLIRGSR
jgi:hypothetical protein